MAQYFVRHGQTDWNLEQRIQGSTDIELNAIGKQQAAAMRDKLSNHSFVAIISSPLKRALQTAETIAEAHPDTPLVIAPDIMERNFGKYEGQLNDPKGTYYGVWDYNIERDTGGGESLHDLELRIYPFLDRIRGEYSSADVLLVAHGGIGLIIRQYYAGKPQTGNLLDLPVLANGAVEVFDIDK